MRKRKFYINCEGEECEEILAYLLDNVRARRISYTMESSGLRIEIEGLEPEIRSAWQSMRRYASTVKALRRRKGALRIELDELVRRAGGTFPVGALIEVLAFSGHNARLEEGVLETDASLDEVVEAASAMSDVVKGLRLLVKGSATRKFVAAAAALTGLDPQSILEKAVELGLALYDEEEMRYFLVKEWRRALHEFVKGILRERGQAI